MGWVTCYELPSLGAKFSTSLTAFLVSKFGGSRASGDEPYEYFF
jgi:hypothetical protein